MQEKITIRDIARLAGVSKATVSRVLNNNPSVDPVLSERVRRIVQEYGFVPDATATGLARGRNNMRLIAVLAPPLIWPAVPEIMRGVASYIEETAYEVVLYSINYEQSDNFERTHSDVLDRILALRITSGLLAILPGELSHHLTDRFQQGLPLVMIDDQEEPGSIPWVGIDNYTGAYEATRYLLQLGHRRIAHISGPQHYYCATERFQGYCQALRDAGLTPDPELVPQGSFEPVGGRACAQQLFALKREQWPDAIFAANDQMAYGVLEVAEQRGIRVPDEISVIGFDDNLLSSHVRPALTTVHQPFFDMGRIATKMLLSMIDPDHHTRPTQKNVPAYEAIGTATRVQLPTSLAVRTSSGVARSLPFHA
jgi:LacI family transcriptional regulator